MYITSQNWEECCLKIRSDPCVSYNVKQTLSVEIYRDPLDALADAELVVSVLRARADAVQNRTNSESLEG